MIYIVVFIISLFCIKLACKFRYSSKSLFILLSLIGLLIPCLLAAFRDLSIGTDVKIYVERIFEAAFNYDDFYTFYLYPNSTVRDILYLLVNYICSKISPEISLLFFVNEVLVIIPIYIALLKSNKNSNSIVIGMLIFYLFFYNATFNMARQSIALSFSILALSYLNNKQSKYFFIYSVISCLFHSSAIVLFPIYLIYKFYENKKNNAYKKFAIDVVLIGVVIVCVYFLPQILKLLSSMGIYTEKFNSILSTYVRNDINWMNTLFYILIYVFINFNKNILKDRIPNFRFYSYISLLCIFILQLGAVVKYSERIGYYLFYPILFLVIPKLAPLSLNKIKKIELRNCIIIFSVFIIYWFFWIVLLQYHDTYPYVFYRG